MSPRPLVLVPGACLGGWAWRDVAHQLRALGHDVYPVTRETQRSAVEGDGDGWRWPVPESSMLETGQFGSTAGLTEKHFAAIAKRGTPQRYATFTSPLRLEHERPIGVRRSVIFCTAGGMTVAAVRELIAQRDPRAVAFADPDWDLRELPTGHWAMFSALDRVAQTLHDIAGCLQSTGCDSCRSRRACRRNCGRCAGAASEVTGGYPRFDGGSGK